MKLNWTNKREEESDHLVSELLTGANDALYSSIDDKIGLVMIGGEQNYKRQFTILSGMYFSKNRVLLTSTSQDKSVINDIVAKTVKDQINKENLKILSEIDDVEKRHDHFKDICQRAISLAKDMLVRYKSATTERPEDNDELTAFDFNIVLLDHQNYLHWLSKGNIELIGINHQIRNLLELDQEQFTHRTKASSLNFGYSRVDFSYILSLPQHMKEHVNLDKFNQLVKDEVDFENTVKSLVETIDDESTAGQFQYGILTTLPH